jgi:hypothetical protein
MASRPTSTMPADPRGQRRQDDMEMDSRGPRVPATCRGAGVQVRRARRPMDARRAAVLEAKTGGSCSTRRTVDEDRARRMCSPIRPTATWPAFAGRADPRCCCANVEGDLLADSTPDTPRVRSPVIGTAGPTPHARHPRTMGLRLRPGRDGDRAGGIRAKVGKGCGRQRPGACPSCSACSPRCSDMFGRKHARDPEGFDEDACVPASR